MKQKMIWSGPTAAKARMHDLEESFMKLRENDTVMANQDYHLITNKTQLDHHIANNFPYMVGFN